MFDSAKEHVDTMNCAFRRCSSIRAVSCVSTDDRCIVHVRYENGSSVDGDTVIRSHEIRDLGRENRVNFDQVFSV